MAETTSTGPWGSRDGAEPAPAAAAASVAAPRGQALQTWLLGLVSTLVLAGWIWLAGGRDGWLWAVAIVGGVFVHEFGHVMVINWAGAGPSSIRIIPFFGGAATMRRVPDSDFKSVLIALAGPAFGLVAALPFYAATFLTNNDLWMTGVFLVGILNLINLAPAAPLDGAKALGPVLARIHPLLERAVLLAIAGAAIAWALSRGSWLFAVVIVLGATRAFAAGSVRPTARPLTGGEWAASLGLYAAAVALCAAVTFDAAHFTRIGSQFLAFGSLR